MNLSELRHFTDRGWDDEPLPRRVECEPRQPLPWRRSPCGCRVEVVRRLPFTLHGRAATLPSVRAAIVRARHVATMNPAPVRAWRR